MFTITAELLVDGAVADSMNFETVAEYEAWLLQVKADAANWDDRVTYEVYRVDHAYSCDGGEGCICTQYILSHVPEWRRPGLPVIEMPEADEPPVCDCGKHYVTAGFAHEDWVRIGK